MTEPKMLTPVLVDRFLSKIDPLRGDQCWLWQGCRDGFGYGLFRISSSRIERSHRIIFRLLVGEIPNGKIILHICDNPPCVNPSHLQLGTRADNNLDRDNKGRHVALAGEDHGAARLSENAVRIIRSTPRSYGVCVLLAEQYGVAVGTVYNIRAGKTWKSVA